MSIPNGNEHKCVLRELNYNRQVTFGLTNNHPTNQPTKPVIQPANKPTNQQTKQTNEIIFASAFY